MENMFCFQCEQTAGCSGCTGKMGVCGKSAAVAQLQDELTGALVGLARATDGDAQPTAQTWKIMVEGLFTTVTNVNFNERTILDMIYRVHQEKNRLHPDCANCASPCGRNDDYGAALERAGGHPQPQITDSFRCAGHGCLCTPCHGAGLYG